MIQEFTWADLEAGKSLKCFPTNDKVIQRLKEAKARSVLSKCLSSKVGCVLVNDKYRAQSDGYNYSPCGVSCEALGACVEDEMGRCMNTLHAEVSAIMDWRGSTLPYRAFITREPCYSCVNALRAAGVIDVYVLGGKPNTHGREAIERLGMSLYVFNDWEGKI